MSIWIWKARGYTKGDYYSINVPCLFPAIGACVIFLVFLATEYPLLGGGLIVTIVATGGFLLLRHRRKGNDVRK